MNPGLPIHLFNVCRKYEPQWILDVYATLNGVFFDKNDWLTRTGSWFSRYCLTTIIQIHLSKHAA